MQFLKPGASVPLILWILCIVTALPSGSFAEVILSEFLAAPGSDWSGDGIIDWRDDEWVEIVNRGDSPVELGDYWISDSVSDPACRFRFSGVLEPDSLIWVTGAEARAWQLDMGLGGAGLSLRNSGGEVVLYRDEGEEVIEVSRIDYLTYQAEYRRSFGRFPVESEEWVLFDGYNLYHGQQTPGSTGCMPSPGRENECESLAVEEADWSRLKQRY
ncbi:MAG: lamin tail domain-containing protein [Candidatus Krumholzibacteria bacterium]|jgi:hypothetical protein|nr:lamin tail domain-containing protein [Candidatus Krumholzibacteria bacterium]MDP6670060.1 lamin tail domain-containing protein [Candidatus Krumholzibacteria bacterium]MDP6797574.1 lamin tail domain-containing protein [Candidatus Krumholzibacteria bacterium]MDP7021721.1 lamin tail domain-containing protein [Candidatus Krumholzibacteria bacterium]